MSTPAARSVDVLVLGLGPAGARAAAAAAARGLDVLAVDRRLEAGRPVQCAEFVPALIGCEVCDLAASVRQDIAAMETCVEEGAPYRTEPFPGRMIDRATFDARRVDEARAAGAECRFDTRARAIDPHGRVTLGDGERIAPKVLVGADGPRSMAGRAIGRVNTELVETRQLSVPLSRAHDATDIFLAREIPGGYAWLFPKGDVANVGAGVARAHMGRLKAIVARLHERLASAGRVGREVLGMTGGAIPVGGMLEPWGVLGESLVLLAGDAAGLAHPITGAGIASAVQSGGLAGEAAAGFLAGDRAAGLDYEEELEALYGRAFALATARRRELARSTLDPRALRRGWIAFAEYGDRPLFPPLGNRGLSPVFEGEKA